MLGRGPSHAVDLPAVLLRRPACAWRTQAERPHAIYWRRGWAVVDETFRGDWGTDSLLDEGHDFEDPLASDKCLDAVADLHGCRRFRGYAVHADMTAATRRRRCRAALVEPDRPQPHVDSCRSAL